MCVNTAELVCSQLSFLSVRLTVIERLSNVAQIQSVLCEATLVFKPFAD